MVLFAVGVVIDVAARAFQLDRVGRLRTGFLLGLRFGGGRWFGGFAELAGVCAADWVHHMKGDRRWGRGL